MKREARLNFIAELISKEEVKTQDELVNILLQHHIDVTQATVSRDIKTLALVKIPAESGAIDTICRKKTRTKQISCLNKI